MSLLAPQPAEIIEKHSFGPDIHAYRLMLLDPGARPLFDFRPGQFNMVYAPGVGEVAISIASDPDDEDLEHIIRIVGRTTRVIDRFQVGDVLGLRGPYGNPWPLQEARWKNVLVVRPQPGQETTVGVKARSPMLCRISWATITSWQRSPPGSGVNDTRTVSPMPS